jgi:NTP pyrophosphatase (non-canonical NTP hydrolase)
MSNFDSTIAKIRAFRDARDWMQFHNPKNLAISINLEAAELLEHFQWKSMEESETHAKAARNEIAEEIADVAIYLFELADNLGIDLLAAVNTKLAKNEAKYPVERAKGSAKKYTHLE